MTEVTGLSSQSYGRTLPFPASSPRALLLLSAGLLFFLFNTFLYGRAGAPSGGYFNADFGP
jgi:hypothetical protein